MKTCPKNPNPYNCGFESAKYLIYGHIELNKQYYHSVKVDEIGEVILKEGLIYRKTNLDVDSICVFFQCARCLRQIIRISEDNAEISAEIAGKLF